MGLSCDRSPARCGVQAVGGGGAYGAAQVGTAPARHGGGLLGLMR
ncbi:hypothetical protein C7S13_5519 [Burkholderia cepacia]|nr:hypothetical protein [Burkholderia cepacia]MDW9249033.1 hypothetical protein [Burkholderia cepacia]